MVLTSQGVYVDSLVEAPAVHHSAAPVGKLTTWAIKVTEGACSKYLELSLGPRWAEDRSLHKPVAPAEVRDCHTWGLLASCSRQAVKQGEVFLIPGLCTHHAFGAHRVDLRNGCLQTGGLFVKANVVAKNSRPGRLCQSQSFGFS